MKNVIAAGLTALAALGIAAAPVQAAYPGTSGPVRRAVAARRP